MKNNNSEIPEQPATTNSPQTNSDAPIVQKKKTLPFSGWWPVVVGTLFGIALRLFFSGEPGGLFSAMDRAFILLAPLAVGAVTVYVAERKARRSWRYYILAAAMANMLFVIGTMAILIEGIICAIIIAPLFGIFGVVGGLIMGLICRMTNWPKHAVYSFAALPLMLGAFPPDESDNRHIAVTQRTIVIQAPADKIWQQLLNVRDIKPNEVGRAWMYRIGVPLPIAGVTQVTPSGLVRQITMGKSIHFEQVSTDWEINRYVKWRYRFDDDSFPPKALDDHVKIGGHYFDIIDTEYTLTPIDRQSTELKIQMRYRVSTQFNWYANPVAQLLIGNFEDVILDFYRHRSI